MKKLLKKCSGLLLLASWFSGSGQTGGKGYTVTGDIQGLKGAYIYLRGAINGVNITDSVPLTNGHFVFTGHTEPSMVQIYTLRENHPHYINPFSLFLENSAITVTGRYDTTSLTYLADIKISGSASQEEYDAFNKSTEKYGAGIDRKGMQEKYEAARKNGDTAATTAIEKMFRIIWDSVSYAKVAYIAAHPKSFVSLDFIYENLASGTPENVKKYKGLFLNMDTSLQFSASGKRVAKRIALILKGPEIGQMAGDFMQPDVAGHPVRLSDYKGKWVLLDFWASWCGPCRAENPNVLKAYTRFKDKGFTVLAISLDNNAANWKKAILEDHLPWTQVSDLKQKDNAAANQFGVTGIPDNFLLNPKGVVIARGLRGEELEKKLSEVFQ